METITQGRPPEARAPRPGGSLSTSRPSLAACLTLALVAVSAVLLIGMRLAQQSTEETIALVSGVERRYEPVLSLSHELGEAVAAFDRQVAELPGAAPAESIAAVNAAAVRMLASFEAVARLPATDPPVAQPLLRDRVQELQSLGLGIAELYRQRTLDVRGTVDALDSLASRTARAAGGVESGGQVLAPKSLIDLATSAAAMRASAMRLFAAASPASADDFTRDRAAFATLLRSHASEFARSPGRAWLELEREDLAAETAAEARFLDIERRIRPAREEFRVAAQRLEALLESTLQRPAWAALAQAATQARITAERAETHLIRVAIAVLVVLLAIAGTIAVGIIGPARALLAGTRRLAGGALDTRAPRGGVRELDELAAAFNDMAETLSTSRKELHDQQLALEDRVAERTAQLRHLANHDPLTGLPNRRELEAQLAAAIERARSGKRGFAVFYMDIDNFKTINDTLGHQFGDRVLREIGTRLQQTAGSNGFLARLGGDEFTLVVDRIRSGAAAEEFVGRIMRAFQKPIRTRDRELLVSLSVGIAVCPEHGDSTEGLLQAADSALFHAKDRGRNGYSLYRPEFLAAASHRFHTEQGLRRALESDDLLLYLQPEVSLTDLQTTVVEALLRWRQPDGRIASAAEFMAVAEQSGLILELSDWVLRRAVEVARRLRSDTWPRARVAVNISAQQFLTGRFVEGVERVLRETQMPADCLEIELTETALQTGRLAVHALHDLRRIGVSVALDDFGAGYSSLKSLEELPLTRVKLDRSLTHTIASNPRAAAIATSMIRLCQGLGLTVTAEGIETPEQLDVLADCVGLQVQGYLIARPAPLEDVARFITTTPARMTSVWRGAASEAVAKSPAVEDANVTFLRPRPR